MSTANSHRIDRNSSMPVYQQIVSDILSRISAMEWKIGDKLPSESQLTEEYESSRVTVRQALTKLAYEGFVEKQRGKGTFVKANPSTTVQDLIIPQIGVRHKSDIVAADIKIHAVTDAGIQVTNNLQLPPESPVFYLERLFLRKDRIICINRAWFPLERVPGMADQPLIHDSITDTLSKRYHIAFSSVENYIESISIDAATAHIMRTSSPSPGLKISSIYTDIENQPVEYSVTIWNGRDTQFHIVLSTK